jgi:outer membrane protein OmpA-like peptidoglycan-associated protein
MRLTFYLLLFSFVVNSQEHDLKLIEKQKFSKVEKSLIEDLKENPLGVEANFIGSVLYMSPAYPSFDIETSYGLIITSKRSFVNLTDLKEIEKLNKVPINDSIYLINLDSIGRISFKIYQTKNTIVEYEYYLKTFLEIPVKYRNDAEKKIHSIAFNDSEKEGTEESFDRFMKKYPNSLQFKEAEKNRNKLGFAAAQEIDNISAYKKFISKYPTATEAKAAQSRIEELAFELAKQINKSEVYKQYSSDFPSSKWKNEAIVKFNECQYHEVVNTNHWTNYKSFIEDYPENTFVQIAKDSIVQIGIRTMDFFPLKYAVNNMGQQHYQKAIVPFYQLFSQIGTSEYIEFFRDNYDETGVDAQLGKDLTDLEMYEVSDLSESEIIQLFAPNDMAYGVLQSLISEYLANKKWSDALRVVKLYQKNFGTEKKYTTLLSMLQSAYDATIKVNKFSLSINTDDGEEYVPVITGDDNTLYFCGKDRTDNFGGEDIYVSQKINGKWTNSEVVEDLSDYESNDAPVSVSIDGNTLVLFKNGEMYYSDKMDYGWGSPIIYPEQINGGSWQADGIYTSDGQGFLFTSAKINGYTYIDEPSASISQMDIYICFKDLNDNWTEPLNLGSNINTPYDDRSPFLHPDMKTLYFSSEGRGGFGDLDVFKSTRLADTCWNCWTEPVNLGKEINTITKDWGYKISTNGDRAIFAKTNGDEFNGSSDVCWLNLPNHLRPDYVATVSGELKDSKYQPVSATIRWEDLTTGKVIGESKTNPKDGSYFIVLPLGKIYGYYVENNEYFPLSNNIDLRKQNAASEVNENIDMVTFKEMIDNGIAVPVNNLFFNVAKAELLPFSIPELKRVAAIIIDKGIKIEISGHTDSDGEEADNILLSQKRTQSVKDFLVKMGVSPDQITTIGYGESKPIMTNDTPEGKAKNRRVEIRFVN